MKGFVNPPGSNSDGSGSGASLLLTDTDLRNDKQAVEFCNSAYRHISQDKRGYERNWLNTISFAQGDQWQEWSEVTGTWIRKAKPEFKVHYKANIVAQYLMTRGSKILRDRPIPHVNPATGEPEDVDIAQVATRVGKYLWNNLNVTGTVLPDFVLNTLTYGTGCLKAFWDSDRGPRAAFEDEDAGLVPADLLESAFAGSGQDDERSFALGDAVIESVSPSCIYPCPGVTKWEELPWLMDCRRQSLDDIRNRHPEDGRKVEETGRETDITENRKATVGAYAGTGVERTGWSSPIPMALVCELWVRPSRQYPKGYHCVVAGEVVLVSEVLPVWCRGEIPYYFLMDRRIPDRLWGVATADDVRDINIVRNDARSLEIENANACGSPPIRLPIGTQLKKEHLHGGPGAVWTYVPTGQHKPEYVQPPTLPDYVKALPDELEGDVMMVSGLNEPTMRAAAPSNVRTASGLAALLKTDDSRQAVFMQEFEECLARAISRALCVVATMYQEDRMVRVVGEKQQVSSFFFRGEQLLGPHTGVPGVNYFDVEVRVETGHRSKEALQQFLLQAASMGLIRIDDDEERRKLLRMMEVGAADDAIFGEITVPETQALQENSWMANDEEETYAQRLIESDMGPHPWDDDEAHLKCLRRFMQSSSFYKVPRERWVRFQVHELGHQKAILMKMQKAAMGGAPPPMSAQGQAPPQGMEAPPSRGMSSVSGQPEEPQLPSPPNLAHTPFAGL